MGVEIGATPAESNLAVWGQVEDATDLVMTLPSTCPGVSLETLVHTHEEQVQRQLCSSVCDHEKTGNNPNFH